MNRRNIQLKISYKGTNYCGWQNQPNGLAIQEVLEKALEELTGERTQVMGSGRTDAGVHACGQVANFHTHSSIPSDRFSFAMNTKIPQDIRILESREVPLEFHSRFSAKGKSYLYKIYQSPINSPFYFDQAFYVPLSLEWKKMEEAAKYFIGEHDFMAFMASGSVVKDTVRTIEEITFETSGNLHEITFKGNGFLYNMVRIIVGTLYEVGNHRREPKEMSSLILGMNRKKAGVTAPAQGLYLKEVYY
ncbi:MAG: tRNA pseudouridine(38-40) synthase TruA [Eubacteriaceae bacterium]